MAVPDCKEALLADINKNYRALKIELEGVSPEEVSLKELEGHAKGTLMSTHNLISYLIGWGELVLKWWDLRSANMPCDFPETGFKWNELGRLAQKFYVDYQDLEYQDLLLRLDHTVGKIIQFIEDQDDAVLYHEPFLDKWTIGRLIQFNSASPYKNARARLKKWKRLKS